MTNAIIICSAPHQFTRTQIDVVCTGFVITDSLPPRIQLDALKGFLKCGVKEGELAEHYKLLGGRQVSATKSPGIALYQEIQTWPEWVENPWDKHHVVLQEFQNIFGTHAVRISFEAPAPVDLTEYS
jgi:hypothetical protein